MFMRHFGHGVGHQQYGARQEVETEMGPEGNDNSDDPEIDINDVSVDDPESDSEPEGEDSEELASGNDDSDDLDSDDLGYASF
jgi:hypothetical protein